MVAIGRALLSSPKLLMLDEPSLGLAPIVVKSVYQALARVKSELPMLLVEQNAAIALNLCDRGYVLLSGKCVLKGTAADLGDREALLGAGLAGGPDSKMPPMIRLIRRRRKRLMLVGGLALVLLATACQGQTPAPTPSAEPANTTPSPKPAAALPSPSPGLSVPSPVASPSPGPVTGPSLGR